MNSISDFMKKYYRHFNAASLVDAAEAYKKHLENNGKMMVTLAGAMSTAELGIILSEMIMKDKVHIISCTGANLEEDIMNLIAHSAYKRIPRYRELTAKDEEKLLEEGYNRVTDTCIPEEQAFKKARKIITKYWKEAEAKNKRYFPHEIFYEMLLSKDLEPFYEINPEHSWVLSAAKKNLPIIVPGWEDSTFGNFFASSCAREIVSPKVIKSGIEYMMFLIDWYQKHGDEGIGFFQIGGGIAGDFPICVVPLLSQDMECKDTPCWKYFCQISDSVTSYGSYSGAVPNEKITWGKLKADTPKFIIESDASIVAPLVFAYVLDK